jgi:formyltetrahydrofolate synthetase
MNNIEIAQQASMRRISEIAVERLGIPEDHLESF